MNKDTNTIVRITEMMNLFIDKYIHPGDVVLDGTMGNGADTLYLSKKVTKEGKVYAFDIQKEAVNNTKLLLKTEKEWGQHIHLILDSHENMDQYIEEEIQVGVFNLGFLPRSESQLTTRSEISLVAIKKALKILKVNGILAIAFYVGHEEGKVEKEIISKELKLLSQKEYHVVFIEMINQTKAPPSIMLITKKKSERKK